MKLNILTGMKKQDIKYVLKEIFIITFSWLLTIALLYIVYLKVRLLYHN